MKKLGVLLLLVFATVAPGQYAGPARPSAYFPPIDLSPIALKDAPAPGPAVLPARPTPRPSPSPSPAPVSAPAPTPAPARTGLVTIDPIRRVIAVDDPGSWTLVPIAR